MTTYKLDPLLHSKVMKEKENPTPPNLDTVSWHSKDLALKDWNKGDIKGVLTYMPNTYYLTFVFDNLIRLLAIGKYEETLLFAYTITRTNWVHWDFNVIKWLFEIAEPDKLRAAGDPISAQDKFILYRGVNGKGLKRRVNGYSWTSSLEKAIWFAKRFLILSENPGVYQVTVQKKDILAVINDREEQEYILRLPLPVRPKRISVDFTDNDHR